MEHATNADRPLGVTLLTIFTVLVGLLGIIEGALLTMSPDVVAAGLSSLGLVIGIMYVAVAAGFWQGFRWAWALG